MSFLGFSTNFLSFHFIFSPFYFHARINFYNCGVIRAGIKTNPMKFIYMYGK